jgi:lipopolysaccharide export system protein LptA
MRALMVFSVAILCATVAFGATLGQATTNEIITLSTGPVTVSAEQVVSDSTVGSITARGKVTADIHRGKFKLEADEMEIAIDRNAGRISVRSRGNVRFDDGTRTMTTNDAMLQVKLTL